VKAGIQNDVLNTNIFVGSAVNSILAGRPTTFLHVLDKLLNSIFMLCLQSHKLFYISMLLCLLQESEVFEITDFTTASDWERSVNFWQVYIFHLETTEHP